MGDAVRPQVATLGEGREATVFEHGEGQVLKLYHEERSMFAAREAEALRILEGSRVPVASLIGTIAIEGRQGLILARVAGEELTRKLGQEPLRLFGNARRLADMHRRIHDVRTRELPSLREELREIVREASLDPRVRAMALDRIDGLPGPDVLCHGDFHPGNILADGDAWSVVDWSAASRGPALADVANTYLLLAHAEPMGPLPWHVRLARRTFASSYVRAYATDEQRAQIERWLLPVAIARRELGFPSERIPLTKLMESSEAHPDLPRSSMSEVSKRS